MSEFDKNNANVFFKIPDNFFGVKGLARHVEHDVLVYIIKSLYRLVMYSSELEESAAQLKKRIEYFERDSLIPGFLSSLTVNQFLQQLEDAQYYYPINEINITFPSFR